MNSSRAGKQREDGNKKDVFASLHFVWFDQTTLLGVRHKSERVIGLRRQREAMNHWHNYYNRTLQDF